jgi:signal transduction histidine kinase
MTKKISRARGGMPLLLFFLLVTLGLSFWLGFQAVGAARSHRMTAEGVLRDYAEITASEYSRRVQTRMDRFFREVFDDVPWRITGRRMPGPDVVQHRLEAGLRRIPCECSELLSTAAFLTLDMWANDVQSIPEDFPFGEKTRAAAHVRSVWEAAPAERIAFTTVGPGQGLDSPSVLFFNASLDESGEEGRGRAIYIIHSTFAAASDMFESLYHQSGLLPEAVTGGQPVDSLVHLEVKTSEGHPLFVSPSSDPELVVSADTLPMEYGGLVVEVGVRPDAAEALVIGGLPRSRIPLLLALMVLALGVGIAALVQIRKEQELTRVREDFISGVSHEFRTPLTQIRMFTELLADGKLQTDDERLRSTEVINREARRLTHLVENILHFSQMGRAPERAGRVERIELQDAIGDLSEAFAPLVDAQEAMLEIEITPPNLTVTATRSGLHRMLANLLDNALKYGPIGQTVRIRALNTDGWVRISVEDEGPGIPVGERARVWDPYHRLDRDVEGQVRGSGIGLSVVAELAQAAGGAAWVEEGRDGGARFVIRIPETDSASDETTNSGNGNPGS